MPDRGDTEGWPHATLGQTHQPCSGAVRHMSDAKLALDAAWRRVKEARLNAASSPDGMRDWCLAAAVGRDRGARHRGARRDA